MTPWPLTPYVDLVVLQRWEVDVKQLAGKVHDCGYDRPKEARDLLHKLVSLATEQLARVERHEREADERGREERECSIPPCAS